MATRWGSAGCGQMSNRFFTALQAWPREDHVLYAAAARDFERAKEFIKKYNGKIAYENYKKLVEDPNIDVVYIGLINSKHFEVVNMCLNAGKNVLCEKPLGMNARQVREMVDLARKKKLFLMEGIWSRCFPSYIECQKRLQMEEIGEIHQVIASFGFVVDAERDLILYDKNIGGSVTLYLGIYLIQFALFVFGAERPEEIVASGNLNQEGVDTAMSVLLKFKNGKVANLSCSGKCLLPNEAFIAGTKGIIKFPSPFYCSESFISPNGEFKVDLPNIEGSKFRLGNNQGLMYQAQEVRECLLKGELESSKLPLDETILIAEIMDTILNQLGVDYSNE